MSARSIRRSHDREIADARRRNARRARRAGLAASAAIGATTLFAPSALASSFEVNTLNDAPQDGCTTAADGCTLRDAVYDADSDGNPDADTITFAPSLSGTIRLTEGHQLYLTDGDALSITDTGPNLVTISGDVDGDGTPTPGVDNRIFHINSTAGPVSMAGLTLTGGYRSNSGGGAIYNGGDLTLTGMTVTGNVVTGTSCCSPRGGGGILATDGSSTALIDSQVTGNKALRGDGGGIRVAGGKLTLKNSKVTGNQATGNDGGGIGGGIDAEKYSVIDIADSTIAGNSATYAGGGIFFDTYGRYSSVYDGQDPLGSTIARSTISGNDSGDGAGIEISQLGADDSFAITRSTISGNHGGERGGHGGGVDFYAAVYGDANISDSTISGNSAADGGGVSFDDGYLYNGRNNRVDTSANTDVIGDGGSVAIGNSTIASNTASYEGGGIYLGGYQEVASFAADGADVTSTGPFPTSTVAEPPPDPDIEVAVPLISTIVADNNAGGGFDAADGDAAGSPNDIDRGDQSNDGFALTNSLIETPGDAPFTQTPAGSSIIGQDPSLGALGDNGGPTQTELPANSSVAVDTGIANGLTVDQRGLARTVDRDVANGAGDGTDIGAVEIAADPIVVPDQPFDKVPTGCPILPAQAGKAFAGDDSAETIKGTPGNDILRGFGGTDDVIGDAGDDCLTGDDDSDVIEGDAGDDLGQGGKDPDSMTAGDGDDRFGGGAGNDVIKLEAGDDKGVGGPDDDRVKGDDGDDLVRGRAGDDKVYGNDGNDDVKGGDDNDKVVGGAGSDKLHGGFGDDKVIGGTGKDKIDCGKGHDVAVASAEDTVSKDCETVKVAGS
jgi:hypothetical protein